jgi:putative membrane protein
MCFSAMKRSSHHHQITFNPTRALLPWIAFGCTLAMLLFYPSAVLAHDVTPLTPDTLWSTWNWDPLLLVTLILTAWLYRRGVRALWQRAGIGRGIHSWQAIAFGGGLLALFVALISPLDAWGATLFSAHMVQHLMLMLLAAPLLVLGMPFLPLLWALPRSWRRGLGGWWRNQTTLQRSWRALNQPLVVVLLHALAVWIWHVPSLYEAAVQSEWIHALEHLSFFGTALLFWWLIVHPGTQGRLGYGASILYLFAVTTQGVVFGALITFAETPWYLSHAANVAAWNLTPLEDQQLAGLLMWIPPSVIYIVAAAALFISWHQALEHMMQRREKRIRKEPSTRTSETRGT